MYSDFNTLINYLKLLGIYIIFSASVIIFVGYNPDTD